MNIQIPYTSQIGFKVKVGIKSTILGHAQGMNMDSRVLQSQAYLQISHDCVPLLLGLRALILVHSAVIDSYKVFPAHIREHLQATSEFTAIFGGPASG